jgi:hypothetical protein
MASAFAMVRRNIRDGDYRFSGITENNTKSRSSTAFTYSAMIRFRGTAAASVMLICSVYGCVVGSARVYMAPAPRDGGGLLVGQLDEAVTGLCVGRKVCGGRNIVIHCVASSD